MSLPGQIALSSRLRAAFTPVASVSMPARPSVSAQLSQALILAGLIRFQALDSITTHPGLALPHEALNPLMAPIIATRGEPGAYAINATGLPGPLRALIL